MIEWGLRMAAGGLVALAATGVSAQQDDESTNRVAAETDWSVFVEQDPTECWAVTKPKKTVNTKGGKTVAVRRGDILLFVSFRPGNDVAGEVAFTGGYPFDDETPVTMEIGGQSFDLFPEGEWAWPESEAADGEVAAAMKGGSDAVLTGLSSRGTTTKDTFSLLGFTAAMEEAKARCSDE